MKIEIEVSEELINDYLQEYVRKNLKSQSLSYSLKALLEKQAKLAIIKAFEETDYSHVIKDKCEEIALKEIEKVAAKKVPGWVQRQVKEMLKYSRARFWEDKE